MMIIAICIVKATRSQKPAPNHCALCSGVAPMASVPRKMMPTATSASANASGNQRSNQSESWSPSVVSYELLDLSRVIIGERSYQSDHLVI